MFAMSIEDGKMKMVEREGFKKKKKKKKKKKSTEGCMLSVVNILFVQSVLGFNCEGGGGCWCLKLSEDMLGPERKC